MGKSKVLSPGKRGQITVLLNHSGLKQKDIAKETVSTQTVSVVRKTLELGRVIDSSRGEVWTQVDNNT